MSRKSLLLSPIFLCAAAAMAATPSSNTPALSPSLPADNSAVISPNQPVQDFQLGQPQAFAIGPSDDVCYRIRAYIFKRDDDRAPELVRSTTCGPRAAHTRDARWPDAKLVPAR